MTSNIWPRQLPKSVQQDDRRSAEIRVYNKLKAELEDEFHVFYSGPWLAIDHHGNEIDGECDFLIAHRKLGILAIEVKGGGISYDPKTGQWRSRDRNGIRHNIKDPVAQARSAKHNTIRKLKDSRYWQEKWIGSHHGVIFPNAERAPRDLGADRPANLFCCTKEFKSGLRGWIGQRMSEGRTNQNMGNLGADGIRALERLFAQPFNLSFRISAAMTEDMELLGQLEPNQFQIIDLIQDIDRVLVKGGAGTGKTVIAIEEALRAGNRGERTLLTCFNQPLGHLFAQRFSNHEKINAGGFHHICRQSARKAGIEVPGGTKGQEWFDQELPDLLVRAVDRNSEMKWDTIIVDEGQDFTDTWWLALEEALVPGGKLRVFADDNQRVYENRDLVARDLESVPIRLNRNLRNTRRIHSAASVHYSGSKIIADGPEGAEVTWTAFASNSEPATQAYDVFRDLVFTEKVDPDDIAILLPRQRDIEMFKRSAAKAEMEFASADEIYSEHAIVDTVRRFKGLERPAIILVAGDTDMTQTEIAYVGFTRAKVFLSVIASDKGLYFLRNGTTD